MFKIYCILFIQKRILMQMFISGIGTVFESVGHQNNDNIRQQLENIFHRDWNSQYSFPLNISEASFENSWNLLRNSYQHSSYEPYIHV